MMKKHILLLVIFYLSFHNSYSQWVNVTNNISSSNIKTITSDNLSIYAGSFLLTSDNNDESPTIFRSTNGGLNWFQTGFTKYSLSLFIRNGRLFVSATEFNGNFISDNSGLDWSVLNYPYSPYEISAFSSNGIYIFACGASGIERSSDNGNTWTNANMTSSISSLFVKGNMVLAGSGTTLRLSTNNGDNWNTGTVGSQVVSVTISDNFIAAGTSNSGVLRSTNNGINWIQTSLNSHYICALYSAGDTIIAGDNMGTGVYVSVNRGETWLQRNEGFGVSKSIQAFTLSNNILFAATTAGVWKRDFHQLVYAENIGTSVPIEFALQQNYPNPFNPVTKIMFSVPENGKSKSENGLVALRVYDITGREIETLVNESMHAGTYEVTFDGSRYPSGVYFYSLTAGNFSETRKMILVK
ncbi:MAG: T9SS type A sorting domain-containing protein [Bacteroidetes bacterium]|nr:T9SS type A sorting domain-containing protein [Bacteroidota bacterium]